MLKTSNKLMLVVTAGKNLRVRKTKNEEKQTPVDTPKALNFPSNSSAI